MGAVGGSSARCSPTRACGWSAGGRPLAAPAATSSPTSSARPTTAAATWGRSSWPRPRAGGATRASRPAIDVHPGPDDERRSAARSIHWGGALRRCTRTTSRTAATSRERWGDGRAARGPHARGLAARLRRARALLHRARVPDRRGRRRGTRTRSCRAAAATRCRRCARSAWATCSRPRRPRLGLHAYPTPACVNSVPYNGLPGHPLPRLERRVRLLQRRPVEPRR